MRLGTAIDEGLHALCAAWEEGGCKGMWEMSHIAGAIQPAAAELEVEMKGRDEELLERMERLVIHTVDTLAAKSTSTPAPSCTVRWELPVIVSQTRTTPAPSPHFPPLCSPSLASILPPFLSTLSSHPHPHPPDPACPHSALMSLPPSLPLTLSPH